MDIILLTAHHGPSVTAASKRNEYQAYFVGGVGER